MNALLLALTLIYAVPLENAKGERIGEITVEDNEPDGAQFVRCREAGDNGEVSCLLRFPSGQEVWLTFASAE